MSLQIATVKENVDCRSSNEVRCNRL